MPTGIDVLGPLLTFLSLELAAGGYLIKDVADGKGSSIGVTLFVACYAISIIFALAFVILIGFSIGPVDCLMGFSGIFALCSVGLYGYAIVDLSHEKTPLERLRHWLGTCLTKLKALLCCDAE